MAESGDDKVQTVDPIPGDHGKAMSHANRESQSKSLAAPKCLTK